VDLAVKELQSLGVKTDVAAHFGLLRTWLLLGPFEGSGGKGFTTAFPPEQQVDLTRTYEGKNEARLRWITHTTTEGYGVVDLNKAIGKHHGAVAYAFAAVLSPTEQAVQLRAGSDNAIQIFLNGRLVFAREEYHHGMRLDQHVSRGTLRAGRNEILVKVCQNEQTDDWAQAWAFQLRVCDRAGARVPLTLVTEKEGARPAGQEVQR
jgi:hypothetical protein